MGEQCFTRIQRTYVYSKTENHKGIPNRSSERTAKTVSTSDSVRRTRYQENMKIKSLVRGSVSSQHPLQLQQPTSVFFPLSSSATRLLSKVVRNCPPIPGMVKWRSSYNG